LPLKSRSFYGVISTHRHPSPPKRSYNVNLVVECDPRNQAATNRTDVSTFCTFVLPYSSLLSLDLA
jgi:hypothetical protein